MANDYYFFTDINQQASNASDYINVQTSGAYGPIPPAAGHTTDEYRVTSLHTATFSPTLNPTAYAACDGIVCVQRIPGSTPPLVNVILKPLVQPALNFAPIKYIIYKGILESSLISGTETAAAAKNDLTKSIWDDQMKKNAKANQTAQPFAPPNPSADALGVGRTAALHLDFGDAKPIDNLFYDWGLIIQTDPLPSFQLPLVKGGWSIGLFYKTSFGLEVLMEGLSFSHMLSSARELETKISVPALTGSSTTKQRFEHWHAKEQVLSYMDPCAFFGSFFLQGVLAKKSGTLPFEKKSGNALYQDVLFAFANKQVAYLDIRNEHGFSFDYFTNYGNHIQLSYDPSNASPGPLDYYASEWPILTLDESSFPTTNTTKSRNVFQIQLPVGDNPEPLLYVSQGYRDINRKRKEFPAELKSAERFFDAFETSTGLFTATRNKSGLTSMTFAVPNVTGRSVTTAVSCYIRLKYFKRRQAVTTNPTVIQSSNYLDNVFYPIDLRILLGGTGSIKSFVYEEEAYVNALGVTGLGFDFIAKIGIARDIHNTSFFLVPTSVRTNQRQASALVTLSGEVSDQPGHYPNFVALKYPLEKVEVSNPVLSASGQVLVGKFVSEGDAATQAKFKVPDFTKFLIIVVANDTYNSWQSKLAATAPTLDPRFRVYLGVKELPLESDSLGVSYTPFELVLRGFAYDSSAGHYKVDEMNTDPSNSTINVKVYTYAGA
ncbi:MAG: hypothetical protein QOH41_2491 [Blastocatellia bacterium]|jgi:hypothetical protein|nr:hypothetical protein [Blastocatellia bacterium]